MKDFLLFIWQLPQNLLGLILYLFYWEDIKMRKEDKGYTLCLCNFRMGVTLGRYMFLWEGDKHLIDSVNHEYGHIIQSRWLGPLYLIIIGIPSGIWNMIHKQMFPNINYYDFYTEKWADKLGKRNNLK